MKIITSLLALSWLLPQQAMADSHDIKYFNRVGFMPVCKQLDPSCRTDEETASEILDVSKDGMTVVYSDSAMGAIGFVDISDPYHPTPCGTIDVGGEPTSVGVSGEYAIVAVNTSPDFVNVSGIIHVIHIETQEVLRTMDLGGQPDSIAVSPDERFVAIAIENERDEDLEEIVEGGLPQLPAGFLSVLVTESDNVMEWELSTIELTGLDGVVEPDDPEPEYVDINEDNICVLTLQENNAIVLIDLEAMEVVDSFTAGTVDLSNIDVVENGVIYQNVSATLTEYPREPDGVTWIGSDYFATADEGDWNGGTRGFTVYTTDGEVVYSSGELLDTLATKYGHYPEERSENKGNEPENCEFGIFGDDHILFVNSERSSLIFVFDVADPEEPVFLQVLPTGLGPEGGKAVPDRNLYVVASEIDDRGGKVRSGITVYMRAENEIAYPTLVSDDMEDGNPIPFSALSGLAAAEPYGFCEGRRQLSKSEKSSLLNTRKNKRGLRVRTLEGEVPQMNPDDLDEGREDKEKDEFAGGGSNLYSIEDSFYNKNRIFEIDTASYPARITKAIRITDSNGVFADALGEGDMKDALINDDMTINIDPEGIAVSQKGGFWLAHEGRGTVGDEARPVESPNVLFKLDNSAVIEKVILLPADVNDIQVRFGFEGVAEDGDYVVVCFQRAWGDEKYPRIGIYNSETEEWKFVFYPLGKPESQNGGWVGLSDIAPVGDGDFLVIERDNQGGEDAAIKRLFRISLGDFSMEDGSIIEKHFYEDLIPYMGYYRGAALEKVEGLAVTCSGQVWFNTDNDGVSDNSGEQLLVEIAGIV